MAVLYMKTRSDENYPKPVQLGGGEFKATKELTYFVVLLMSDIHL